MPNKIPVHNLSFFANSKPFMNVSIQTIWNMIIQLISGKGNHGVSIVWGL